MGSFSIWHWIVVLIVFFILFSPVIIGIMVMGIQRSLLTKHEQSGLLKKGFYGYS
jgi:Sec-independent protein translocase protein TatA